MIRIDHERVEVVVDGKHIKLTPKEFGILRALKKANGRVLTREFILTNVWGYSSSTARSLNTRKIDVCLYRIRFKIGKVSRRAAGRLITVPKHGYKLTRRNCG